MENIIYDSKEAISHLHISYDTLMRLIRNQEIPYFRIGRKYLFRKSSLDEYIRNQERKCMECDGREEE